jgi:cytochrome c biogenesis factor
VDKKINAGRRILRTLSSVKLAISLLVLIAVVLIVATIIKNQTHAQRYIYHSWWFISILGLFCLNLVLCSAGRWSFKVRKLGTTVTHAGVLVMVAGAVVSTIWGKRGTVPLFIGETTGLCYDDERRPIRLPFEVRLDDFKVERYTRMQEALVVHLLKEQIGRAFPIAVGQEFGIEGTPCKVTILRYEPDFVVLSKGEYGSRSGSPDNPAIHVRVNDGSQENTQWVFLKFPGMHQDPEANVVLDYRELAVPGRIKDFKSRLRLTQDGEVVASKTIEVNRPLRYAGWTIYQSFYDRDHELWSGLEITNDPGVPFIYLGFILISLGVLFGFYVRPILTRKSGGRANGTPERN